MTIKYALGVLAAFLIFVAAGYYIFFNISTHVIRNGTDATPQRMSISGTFVCLPHLDTTGPQTEECAFGIQTDAGEYYAVNFGQSAAAAQQFQSGAHVSGDGFVVLKEALNTDQWAKYNMKGIFTFTSTITPSAQGKIDINAVCEGALAYMTFTDANSANQFVAECKQGNHPEVIEQFKAQLNAGSGAQI